MDMLVSEEAERAVIGSCLINPDAYFTVSDKLQASDFHFENCRLAWGVFTDLAVAGRSTADVLLVSDRLQERGELARVGGLPFLVTLVNETPSSYHIQHYADVVADKARRRRLLSVAGQIGKLSGDANISDPVAEAMKLLLDVPARQNDIAYSRESWLAYLDAVAERKDAGGIVGLATGFLDIDHITGGFRSSDLVICAGRPGMGKTTLADGIAGNVAARGGRVLFASLEMDVEQLQDKRVTRWTHKPQHEIERGLHIDIVTRAVGEHAHERVDYVDDGGLTTDALFAIAYREHMRAELSLIVVDYLQLLNDVVRGEDTARITYISRRLKVLARSLKVPVLCLSQLNRAVEQRKDKRPMLSDLRQSGAIEQDADMVLLMYREAYYDEEAPNIAEVHVAKNRHGKTGLAKLLFRPEWCQFVNLERSQP